MPRKKEELNKREKTILKFIEKQIMTDGYPPSVREIGQAVGLSSTATVHGYLERLEKKGYIKKKDKKITLRSLTYYGINLFFALGAIAGAIATKFLDIKSIFIASVLLVIPFIMMFKPSENIEYV